MDEFKCQKFVIVSNLGFNSLVSKQGVNVLKGIGMKQIQLFLYSEIKVDCTESIYGPFEYNLKTIDESKKILEKSTNSLD